MIKHVSLGNFRWKHAYLLSVSLLGMGEVIQFKSII